MTGFLHSAKLFFLSSSQRAGLEKGEFSAARESTIAQRDREEHQLPTPNREPKVVGRAGEKEAFHTKTAPTGLS